MPICRCKILRSRLKNGPPPKPCDLLCMVRFITLCFMMSKAFVGGGHFQNAMSDLAIASS